MRTFPPPLLRLIARAFLADFAAEIALPDCICALSRIMASAKPSALVDTRVIYCGDNLEQLQKLPPACVDLMSCYKVSQHVLLSGHVAH